MITNSLCRHYQVNCASKSIRHFLAAGKKYQMFWASDARRETSTRGMGYSDVWFSLRCAIESETNGHHFADDIFKSIFLNENVLISIKISLKCIPRDIFNNIPALVQMMAWSRPGIKPLSEPVMVIYWHICVTRPRWLEIWFSPVIDAEANGLRFAVNIFKFIFLGVNSCISMQMSQ